MKFVVFFLFVDVRLIRFTCLCFIRGTIRSRIVNTAYAIGISNEAIDEKCELRERARARALSHTFGSFVTAEQKCEFRHADKMITSNRLKMPIGNGQEQSDTHKMSELIPTYIFP